MIGLNERGGFFSALLVKFFRSFHNGVFILSNTDVVEVLVVVTCRFIIDWGWTIWLEDYWSIFFLFAVCWLSHFVFWSFWGVVTCLRKHSRGLACCLFRRVFNDFWKIVIIRISILCQNRFKKIICAIWWTLFRPFKRPLMNWTSQVLNALTAFHGMFQYQILRLRRVKCRFSDGAFIGRHCLHLFFNVSIHTDSRRHLSTRTIFRRELTMLMLLP